MVVQILIILTWNIVIFLTFFLVKFISKVIRESNESDQLRELRITTRIEELTKEIAEVVQLVVRHQSKLKEEMTDIFEVLENFNTFINLQLQQLQELVKSDMISARRDELVRTRELKNALERLVSITTMARQPPIGSDSLAINAATSRIEELEAILEMR